MITKLEKTIHKHLGSGGRMISFSKSTYRKENPDHTVYFNAQIHDMNFKFLWGGDLDITKDMHILDTIQTESGEKFYVTPEMVMDEFTEKDMEEGWCLKFG